jgi:hypothetical protein
VSLLPAQAGPTGKMKLHLATLTAGPNDAD